MNCISDIFHKPSFKKDYVFIKQLETNNKNYQDKIWRKLIGNSLSNQNPKIESIFQSHPSHLSIDRNNFDNAIRDEYELEFSEKFKRSREKSASNSKIVLNENRRKKLRQKLTQHLANGTLEKFEIGKIGDHVANERESKIDEDEMKNEKSSKDTKEIFMKKWKNSSENRSSSDSSSFSSKDSEASKSSVRNSDGEKSSEKSPKEKLKEKTENEKKIETPTTKTKKEKNRNPNNKIVDMRKSRHYMERCIEIIKDISLTLDQGITPPDGNEDFTRRQNRTKEFTSRFSRIYMYPLLRHISQVSNEKILNYHSKFTGIYQLIHRALQAFFNHLPTTVGISAHQKLKDYVRGIIEICEKNMKFFKKDQCYENEDYTKILKDQCGDLIQKLDENFISPSIDSLLKSKSAILPTTKARMPPKKRSVNKKFAMYNTTTFNDKSTQWRKMIESLEAQKPKVKSRYRTAMFKHRPPIEKQQIIRFTNEHGFHRLDDEKSLTVLKNTPVFTPINEDGIQTMIQYENEKHLNDENEKDYDEYNENQEFQEIIKRKSDMKIEKRCNEEEDILAKLLNLVRNNDEPTVMEPDHNLSNTILLLQQCLNLKNQNNSPFETKNQNYDGKELETKISTMVISDDKKKLRKTPSVTVTGAKNAKLFCIKDDNSILSDIEDSDKLNVPQNSPRKTLISSEVQTSISQDYLSTIRPFGSLSTMKISRVDKPTRMLKLLPKETAINIIQGKLTYHKFHKGNYMYRKTQTIKPWELMNKISEDILDFALLGIAKEIEVNELLDNIYNSEFQY